MREHVEAIWGQWQPSSTLDAIDLTGHSIIEVDGRSAGCVAVAVFDDHVFLRKLYLLPDYQRRGIGTAVLEIVVGEAARRGLPTRLSVLATNPAQSFYRRKGFVAESETPERIRMIKPVTVARYGG